MKDPPLGWAKDGLTQFIDDARSNQFATFSHKPIVQRLIALDALLTRSYSGAINIRPWFVVQFFSRSHNAFRSAAANALSGALVETCVLLRSSLEAAAYGLFIGSDEERAEVWLNRMDDAASRKKSRNVFKFTNVLKHAINIDPALGSALSELYEKTIDRGAHPNSGGYLLSLEISQTEDGRHYDFIHLHGNGEALDSTLRLTAQTAVWALMAFGKIYPERYELIGLSHDLKPLTKGL